MTKFLTLLTLILASACSHRVENPGANAKTFTFNEFDQEYRQLEVDPLESKYGFSIERSPQGSKKKTPDLSKTQDFLKHNIFSNSELKSDLENHIKKIEVFLSKFSGYFRIRAPNGDLDLLKLNQEITEDLIAKKEVLKMMINEINSWNKN